MISKSWLLAICQVIVFLPESLSQNCNQLRKMLLEDNRENVKLLTSKMGTTFPRQCLGDIINFSSSSDEESALNIQEIQNEDFEIAIYEILRQVLYIFNQNHSKLSWDENSLAVFKLGLDQQIEKLGSCVNEEPYIRVEKFFDRIHTFLRHKEYSLCAWEIAQIKISQSFLTMDQLIRKLPEEELPEECSQTRRKLQDANNENLELLSNNMKSTVARVCLGDIVNFFSNPNEEYIPKLSEFQEKNATEAIYEILQQISSLFDQNNSQLPWDEDSITIFQLGLDHELEILQPCMTLGTVTEKVNQEVIKYFERINDLLKDKKYSRCAWEITQIEVRRCLIILDKLITKVPEEGIKESPDIETFMREQLDEIATQRKRSSTSAFREFFL